MQEREIARLLKGLIALETINPPGNEYLAAGYLEKYFKKRGIHTKRFEKKKGRTNLLAWVGKGKPELMIVAHSDVVPAGVGWKTNPFKGVEKKGKVYGRGAADNKGPLAAAAVLLCAVKKREKELKGKLSLLAAADEEKGSGLGAAFLLKEKKVRPDFVVVPDVFMENREISIGEKGLLHLKAVASGKQAHASEPWRGENAIDKMNAFLGGLKRWKLPRKAARHFSRATLNIGTISGGEAVNIVPGYCETGIDIRYPPNYSREAFLKPIKRMAKRFGVKVSVTEHQPPFCIGAKSRLIKSIRKNAKKVVGRAPKISTMPGTTVCKKFVAAGIPTAGFGPGKMVAHMSNEFIELKQLAEFAEIMALVGGALLC